MKILSFLFVFLSFAPCFAGIYGEVNGYYNTDTFVTSSTSSSSKTFYGLDIYANLETKHYLFAGFHVDQVGITDNNGTTTSTFSSQNMGPMFLWLIDKRKIYSLALGYDLVAKGTYDSGSSNSKLSGTGIFATFAAMPEVAENFYIGIKLNYYSLSYSKSEVGSASSDVSYSRSLIFPSISFAWRN
jgi:hypothetical protein